MTNNNVTYWRLIAIVLLFSLQRSRLIVGHCLRQQSKAPVCRISGMNLQIPIMGTLHFTCRAKMLIHQPVKMMKS